VFTGALSVVNAGHRRRRHRAARVCPGVCPNATAGGHPPANANRGTNEKRA